MIEALLESHFLLYLLFMASIGLKIHHDSKMGDYKNERQKTLGRLKSILLEVSHLKKRAGNKKIRESDIKVIYEMLDDLVISYENNHMI